MFSAIMRIRRIRPSIHPPFLTPFSPTPRCSKDNFFELVDCNETNVLSCDMKSDFENKKKKSRSNSEWSEVMVNIHSRTHHMTRAAHNALDHNSRYHWANTDNWTAFSSFLGASSISELACRSDSRAWPLVSPSESWEMLVWEEPLNSPDYSSVWFLSWFSLRSWVFMAWSWPSTYTPNKRNYTNVAIILSFNPSSKNFRSVWRSNKRDDSPTGGFSSVTCKTTPHNNRLYKCSFDSHKMPSRGGLTAWRLSARVVVSVSKGRDFTGRGSRAQKNNNFRIDSLCISSNHRRRGDVPKLFKKWCCFWMVSHGRSAIDAN